MRKLFVALTIWAALIFWAAADSSAGPPADQMSLETYRELISQDAWRTTDPGTGAPVDCVFIGISEPDRSGFLVLTYRTWADSSMIVKEPPPMRWVVDGDRIDIQGNFFVLGLSGQLHRVVMDAQTVWPGSW
jgi:hypothetical protein